MENNSNDKMSGRGNDIIDRPYVVPVPWPEGLTFGERIAFD